jgi:hypothetical protein
MSAAAMSETRLEIGRWLNTYLAGADLLARNSNLREMMDRVDRSIAADLPSCEHWVHSFGTQVEEVWRIRRVELFSLVDLSSPTCSDIANRLSNRLSDKLHEVTQSGGESDNVVRFPSRAAYLAQFVIDLAGGRARGKWYYEEFQSLSELSAGRAIAEVLSALPGDGVETLLHLAASRSLESVLAALTPADARRICSACFGDPIGAIDAPSSEDVAWGMHGLASESLSAAELSQWCGRLLCVWNEEPLRGLPSTDHHDALRWLANASLRFPGVAREPAALAALAGLLALRRVLASIRDSVLADRLVRRVAEGSLPVPKATALARGAGAASPEPALRFLERIAHDDPDWASQATAALIRQNATYRAASEGESSITPYGGIFLVAPSLIELRLHEISEAAAGDGRDLEAAALFRHIVMINCIGAQSTDKPFLDPAFSILSGYDRADSSRLSEFAVADLAWAHALFLRNLAETVRCDFHCLIAECIPGDQDGACTLLIRDAGCGAWVYGRACGSSLSELEEELCAAIEFISRQVAAEKPSLILRDTLAVLSDSRALQERTTSLVSMAEGDIPPDVIAVLEESVCTLGRAPRETLAGINARPESELRLLVATEGNDGACPAFQMLTALIARAALRGFARRLIGFQSSSAQFLHRNFLAGIATISHQSGLIQVEMPRVPLAIVLQLSGLDRQTYAVPWLKGRREVCLLPACD